MGEDLICSQCPGKVDPDLILGTTQCYRSALVRPLSSVCTVTMEELQQDYAQARSIANLTGTIFNLRQQLRSGGAPAPGQAVQPGPKPTVEPKEPLPLNRAGRRRKKK